MCKMCEINDQESVSRENLVAISRLMAEALLLFAARAEGARTELPAVHEMLHEAMSVFADVGMIVDTTGPQLVDAWHKEKQRIATIARQN